jgi:diacylglycerol kinase (ATP)
MVYIHFIVNPISGNGKHNLTASNFRNFFPRHDFRIEVDYTKYKGHAIKLTQDILAAQPDCIVACGGDGTINEVASCLVNSTVKLGIVPVGSGNGLASHLTIPKEIEKALGIIKGGKVSFIDVGKVNDHYFFSNMGIGIDAMIIKRYERSANRTLSAYVKSALSSGLKFKSRKTILNFGNRVMNAEPLLLFVSNSNEMGYNMSLTPKASLNDGWLDLLVVPKLSLAQKIKLGYCVLTSNIGRFKKGTHELVQNLRIEQPETIFMDIQIDGEFHNIKTNTIDICVLHKGLRVITA